MDLSELTHAQIWLPLIAAIVTGAVIGLERELNAKAAGVRTHTLVCLSCTLVMLAGSHQGEWTMDLLPGQTLVADPTRMAHGILTGIGFLGAGVIFRQGASVMGLTTAASLWMTAALGVLYGTGMVWLAVCGAVATLSVLAVFRVVHRWLPEKLNVTVNLSLAPQGDAPLAAVLDVLRRHGSGIGPLAQRWVGPRGAQTPALHIATTMWLNSLDKFAALAADLARLDAVRDVSVAPVASSDPLGWSRDGGGVP